MKANTAEKVQNAALAWELYSAGNYQSVLTDFQGQRGESTGELQDIIFLSALELGQTQGRETSGKSAFAVLAEGMQAHLSGNYKVAASNLGGWLLKKDYFSSLILRRFLRAAEESENYKLLLQVCARFIEKPAYKQILAEPLLNANFYLDNHEEVVALFEKYREFYTDKEIIQKVAFAMMHTGRYKDAERFLLFLFKKLHGKDYEQNFESAKERYNPIIARIPELEKRRKLSRSETMDLGMAYLFSSNYSKALRCFEKLAA